MTDLCLDLRWIGRYEDGLRSIHGSDHPHQTMEQLLSLDRIAGKAANLESILANRLSRSAATRTLPKINANTLRNPDLQLPLILKGCSTSIHVPSKSQPTSLQSVTLASMSTPTSSSSTSTSTPTPTSTSTASRKRSFAEAILEVPAVELENFVYDFASSARSNYDAFRRDVREDADTPIQITEEFYREMLNRRKARRLMQEQNKAQVRGVDGTQAIMHRQMPS
jgi:hypothetical protein